MPLERYTQLAIADIFCFQVYISTFHPSTSSASAQAMATYLKWDTALDTKFLLVISLNKFNDGVRYDLVAEMMGPGHTPEKDR